MTRHQFSEVINDLISYFLLGDILLLKRYKKENGLSNNLALDFTTNDSSDQVVQDGIFIPMPGIENHLYTIIFNLSTQTPELLKEKSRLQHRRGGYVLRIENNSLMLFTWRILENFTDATLDELLKLYNSPGRPMIELENGWYDVEILGGEIPVVRDGPRPSRWDDEGGLIRPIERALRTPRWYDVEKLGGKAPDGTDWFEPAFEFVLKKVEGPKKAANIDLNYQFAISQTAGIRWKF